MDTFLSYFLICALLCVLILYLYQSQSKTSYIPKHLGESFLPIIFDTCTNKRSSGMPVHRVGPIYNFHQSFNKSANTLNTNNSTGIHEMGWRNIYLANFTKNQVPIQDPFEGTPVRNFLNNLENVDNIYRKC